MAKNFEHLIHKHTNVTTNGDPKLPTSSQIEYGELAVNYARGKETISLKNANNEIVAFSSDKQVLGKTLQIMGITPVNHTLADAGDSYYYDSLNDGEAGAWFISYSDGNMLITPSTANDESGRIKLSSDWQSRLGYSGMTWANVGDILLVYRQSSLICAYKILSINEAGETRIGLMSPNDKVQVNKISGIESALSGKLPYSTASTNIGNVGDGAYTNVTAGRTNWIDTTAGGGAVKLGNLQIAVDPSGRLYSRNSGVNNGIWNVTNQLVTIGGTNLDAVYTPSVVGYGVCQNGPTNNPLTVYSFTSSDLDGNGFRSILQVAIDRTDSSVYLRTTFFKPADNSFTKTNWIKVPDTSDYVSVQDFEDTEEAISFALNDLNSRILELDTLVNESNEDFEKIILDNELVTAAALNDLNARINNSSTGITEELETLRSDIDELDLGTASALTDLNTRIENVEGDIEEIDEIVSSALNDLDGRLETLEDDAPYAGSFTSGGPAKVTAGVPYGVVDSTSTSTAFTVQISEYANETEYRDGMFFLVYNNVIASATGWTIDVNGLGAKPVYTATDRSRSTTGFSLNKTFPFFYDSTLNSGDGGWVYGQLSDANTDTIGYQIRTNSKRLRVSDATVRYRIFFTSADGTKYVPSTTSTSTNSTTSRAVNQTPIDPFGEIVYYSSTTALSADGLPAATTLWEQYSLVLGYSFNRTNAALTLTSWTPVYIKCAPQSNGSAIIDDTTPYVQALPSTEDGKIYIFLGIAYDATHVEMLYYHPVYYYKNGAIRLWTNAADGLPTVTSSDNGKTLMVVNGVWTLVAPSTVYSGSGTPSNSQGNNGDIYVQTS